MSYETDALVAAAQHRALAVPIIPDLLWGEIDDGAQLHRARSDVLPAIIAREG